MFILLLSIKDITSIIPINAPPTGEARQFTVRFDHDGSINDYDITFPTSMGGSTITLSTGQSARYVFHTEDGGLTYEIHTLLGVTLTGGGNSPHNLDFHDDVVFGTPNDKDYLRYNGIAGEWQDSPILLSDLALADGKVIIGNASGVGAEQTVSGDISITNTGVATIPNDVITLSKIAHGTANKFIGYDGTGVPVEKDGVAISPLTTKGDLFGYSTGDARIPVGTNGQVLTADSTQALGVKWETPSSGVTNEISQTNSRVTVTDLGNGQITGVIDGQQRFAVNATSFDFEVATVFGSLAAHTSTFQADVFFLTKM